MPLHAIDEAVPTLRTTLETLQPLADRDLLWGMLRRLLLAPAPSGGANLPGAVGDTIAALAEELGVRDRVWRQFASTGNVALWLGADKPVVDVIVVAHMDRPSYRVSSADNNTLYPICADRFPQGTYRAPAKAVVFQDGQLATGARGTLISQKSEETAALHFEVEHGSLDWQDTILLDAMPTRASDDTITGSGLDNGLGVLIALLAAAALRQVETVLHARSRRCLFVFTDQEEGPPDAFFGHGAARLTHVLLPPTRGCIVVDGQNPADPSPRVGRGASVAAVSGAGRGSVVPPNYQALITDLAEALNTARPATIQKHSGYLSRSDDMILSRWTRILALSGPPLASAHTAQETAHLGDVQNAVWWLVYFLAAALPLAPELGARYALDR